MHGGNLKRGEITDIPAGLFEELRDPIPPLVDKDWSVLIAGVGGTGVVTIGAVLGMAAHVEGKGSAVFDMTGVSQKNGAVYSHLKIIMEPEAMSSADVGLGEANLLLGCDLVASVAPVSVRTIEPGRTRVVINETLTPTPQFQTEPNMNLDGGLLLRGLEEHAGRDQMNTVAATKIALALTGDTIGANTFMIGYALQLGALPLSVAAIERAIELNGVAVPFNIRAFRLGRLAAEKPQDLTDLLPTDGESRMEGLENQIQQRVAFLSAYQDAQYATQYQNLLDEVREAERSLDGAFAGLTNAVAKCAFKLMAYKDEYEVARLFTDGQFSQKLEKTFDGDYRLKFHLAPPLFAKKDPRTGLPRKSEFGSWMFTVFKILARLKGLRGTRFDLFGWTTERRLERRLRDQYFSDIKHLCDELSSESYESVVELAKVPEQIRGFGHVKAESIEVAEQTRMAILEKIEAIKRQDRAA